MYETDFIKIYKELEQLNKADITEEPLLETTNKIIKRFDRPFYSGSFSGLNNISFREPSPEELAKKAEEQAKAEEEKRKRKRKSELITAAKRLTTADGAHGYNKRYASEILQNEEYPAVDPETLELVYDAVQKEELIQQAKEVAEEKRIASIIKGQQTRAANQAKAATMVTWYGYATINGQKRKVATKSLPEDTDQTECYEVVKQQALKYINQEAHECRVFGEPFKCSIKLLITRKPYKGKEETVDTISLK